jgi:hypothetical protein
MSEVKAERRRSTRYPANLVVEMEEDRKGVTRNVSASGVFMEMRERPVVGEPVHFTLVLEHATPKPIRLACVGNVLRVEPQSDGYGIAVAITSHGIESSP